MRIQPVVVEAYARRMAASLAADLGAGVASIRRTMFDCQGTEMVVEWLAKLEDGSEIRLSAVVTKGCQETTPADLSQEELERLRDLGISPGGTDHA